MEYIVFGIVAFLLMALVSGAFFTGQRIESDESKLKNAEAENEKNRKILQANMDGRDLSDDAIAAKLSKLASKGNIIVYPGRGKDKS